MRFTSCDDAYLYLILCHFVNRSNVVLCCNMLFNNNNIDFNSGELAHLSRLIDSIYQGATDPAHWNVVLPAIAAWLGADRGLLYTPLHSPENGGFHFTYEIPADMIQLWWTRYQPQDVWRIRSVERGLVNEGNIILGEEVISLEELKTTQIYRELFLRMDTAHLISGIVFGVESVQPVFCALVRGERAGAFTAVERERFGLLVPHISRALGVMRQLRDLEFKVASSLGALDLLGVPVLLFGVRGQVTFANRAAHRILEEGDGLRLRNLVGGTSSRQLVAEDRVAGSSLASAISSAISPDILHAEHFSHAVQVPRSSGQGGYSLNFSSLPAQNEFGSGEDTPRAIAFITDSAQPIRVNEELLKKTYGLTAAELRLVGMMAESLTIEQAAHRLSLSSHTVRTQLKSIYAKTNINNRAKLMRLIMTVSQTSA